MIHLQVVLLYVDVLFTLTDFSHHSTPDIKYKNTSRHINIRIFVLPNINICICPKNPVLVTLY